MTSSLLDPHGPFTMLNPLCELEPGETHAILLTFSPGADKIYHEVMHIYHPCAGHQGKRLLLLMTHQLRLIIKNE